jgi:hypothetical protein
MAYRSAIHVGCICLATGLLAGKFLSKSEGGREPPIPSQSLPPCPLGEPMMGLKTAPKSPLRNQVDFPNASAGPFMVGEEGFPPRHPAQGAPAARPSDRSRGRIGRNPCSGLPPAGGGVRGPSQPVGWSGRLPPRDSATSSPSCATQPIGPPCFSSTEGSAKMIFKFESNTICFLIPLWRPSSRRLGG